MSIQFRFPPVTQGEQRAGLERNQHVRQGASQHPYRTDDRGNLDDPGDVLRAVESAAGGLNGRRLDSAIADERTRRVAGPSRPC